MDLAKVKKVYVIGIKGSGIVAVVQILDSMGIEVTGSDTHEKFFTDAVLTKLGIKYFEKFSAKNIPDDADLVVYSTAYNAENNEEFRECVKRGVAMKSYPEILADFFNQKYGIAVCGTHGKTTTSAMLSVAMQRADKDPGAIIGSRVIEWGSNALAGKGEFFVIEADEFQNKLRLYNPKAVIFTSADWDHPDFYKTFEEYKKAFSDFIVKIPRSGFLVVWGDSVATNEIACSAKCEIIKYGFQEDNDVIIFPLPPAPSPSGRGWTGGPGEGEKQKFSVEFLGKDLGEFETQLVGDHNLLNVAAVIAVCHKLKLDMEKVREAIRQFRGTSRRFEYIGQRNGAILIDDYGHHPEEVRVTLKATREIYPDKNIIAVFHPHSFSRTETFLQDFAQSFDSASEVIVLDIYGSARENTGNVSSQNLVDLINKYDRGKAQYIPTIDETVDFLKEKIGENDVVLCIGAGNVFEVAEKLEEK
ncbi:MAG: UDP-N-acetylmuramate--L-alanine ligase [Patescibacteria group bacterium]